MVGATVGGGAGAFDVRRLLHMGGLPGPTLLLWALPLALLFSGAFWGIAAQLVRWQTGLVARLADFFSGLVDSLGAGRVPPDLLLLPGCILQSVLGRSPFL